MKKGDIRKQHSAKKEYKSSAQCEAIATLDGSPKPMQQLSRFGESGLQQCSHRLKRPLGASVGWGHRLQIAEKLS